MSFSFLLGILACCISAFVTVNRFGFALEGSWCAVDRIYYDSVFGQLKDSNPKWKGFAQTNKTLINIKKFCGKIKEGWKYKKDYFPSIVSNEESEDEKEKNKLILKISVSLNQLKSSCQSIEKNNIDVQDFMKGKFLDDFSYYAKTLKACLKILSMIYYCLLLIAITGAGVSMMFYACLKRQGYLITFMHVLWNVIRFFMFSFFLYGTAYGIAFLTIRDSIAVIKEIFGDTKEGEPTDIIKDILGGGGEFIKQCLGPDSNILDEETIISVKNYFNNITALINIEQNVNGHFTKLNKSLCNEDTYCSELDKAVKNKELDISFDCRFLRYDLNQLYRALSDASVESRILAALSLCSSFFGAVAVYFFLLVMHHYNNELFFDSGKSIFTGFDGFGGGYKKKMHDKDPAYKKRKLRAEIELTSKNDEQSAYKNVNKNEDEE